MQVPIQPINNFCAKLPEHQFQIKQNYHTSILKIQYFLIKPYQVHFGIGISAIIIKNAASRKIDVNSISAMLSLQLNLHSIIIIFGESMLTRKLRQTSTRKQKKREIQKKMKVMPNPISKEGIRNLLKNRLSSKTLRKGKNNNALRLMQQAREGVSIFDLIDDSKCECPICLQIAISPIVLPCGHCYCLKCFEENSIFNLRCCLCRLQINPQQILPAKMIQTLIDRFILPTTPEEINYWCRKGEFSQWQSKRRIDLQVLRVGDNIDVRTDDKNWRRGVIACFLFQENQYSLEIKYCMNAKLQSIFVPASSRRLAPNGFFTKGQYLKYRTVSYESKFVESIEIPQIKCDFIDESMESIENEEKCSEQPRYWPENNDLALELFEYEMKQWENVFQFG